MLSTEGLNHQGIVLLFLLFFKAALAAGSQNGIHESGLQIGNPESGPRRFPWARADRIAHSLCGSQFIEGGASFVKCRMKVRALLLADMERMSNERVREYVMTSPMLRVLPCTREMCSKEENQSDLFECIRSKCIYQSHMSKPRETGNGPINGLNTLGTSQFGRPGGNGQPMGLSDLFANSNGAISSGKAASGCLGRCTQNSELKHADPNCYERCMLHATSPEVFGRPPEAEAVMKVGKRWSSRLCMEAHCKRFEVNGGQWFRCGQNNCGR